MLSEYQFQMVLALLDSLGTRLATLEHTLERNNDLVAALLKVNGVTVNIKNGTNIETLSGDGNALGNSNTVENK